MGERQDEDRTVARRLWQVIEPLHAVTYFAPESRAATDALGLHGGWMGYFGCRAAPLGPVGPAVVTAVFYNFHPTMVARAVPDVWAIADPEQLLGARLDGIDQAYRRLFGDAVDEADLVVAAELSGWAVQGCDVAGRPLAAANAALDLPNAPHLRLWQQLTTLREHRGVGHVATLVQAGVGPAEALVLQAATERSPLSELRRHRGWPDEEWNRGARQAVAAGWIEVDGTLTEFGRVTRERIEADTDRLAMTPYRLVGREVTDQLFEALLPFADRVMSSGEVPRDNLMGLSWPPDPVEGT
jgi:hypothetical protein